MLQNQKQSTQLTNYQSTSRHNRSVSDLAIIKSSANIQQKLKRQLNNKFNVSVRKDQANQTTVPTRRKSSASLILNNPLTKSTYSMNDSIIHKSALKSVVQHAQKPIKSVLGSRNKVASSYRERYNSSIDSPFFKTRAEQIDNIPSTPRLKPSFSAREIIPKRSSVEQNFKSSIEARRNKFKLLFRQKSSNYKSVSERKISRIDAKIQSLKQKKIYLQSLMPRQKPKIIKNKVKPRGEIVKKQKIMTLTLNIIKYLELYFNMYQHNNIVGGHLKNIEGYSNKIKGILMLDINRAKRITNVQEITNLFWGFQSQNTRPEYFGQQDLALYNILNGYYLKMEKKYIETLSKFNHFESKKRKEQKQQFKKTYDKFQKKMGRHDKINKINNFIEQRVRHDQSNRQQFMSGLQKRGVQFNLIERSKQLILRQKEIAMKKSIKNMIK